MARYSLGSTDPSAPATILAVDGGRTCGFASTGPSRDSDRRRATGDGRRATGDGRRAKSTPSMSSPSVGDSERDAYWWPRPEPPSAAAALPRPPCGSLVGNERA